MSRRGWRDALTDSTPALLVLFLAAFSAWEAASHALMVRVSMAAYHGLSVAAETGMAAAMALLALAALRRQNRRLAELMELRKALAEMEVHDLRTPLTALILGLAVARRRLGAEAPAEVADSLELCQDSARRLKAMLEDLLDVARLEEREEALERVPGPFGPLLQRAARSAGPAAEEKQIRLSVEVAPDLPPGLRDEERLERVVDNLMANALRHTPRGGRVRLAARVRDGALEVEVADSGPGIPPMERGRVFQRYARLGAPGRASFGLGLTFCQMVVTSHEGTLEADEAPEGGACLRLRLPLQHRGGEA